MKYYRFFTEEEHRTEFINGNVRFGNLNFYKNCKDVTRKDKDEGKTIWKRKLGSNDVLSTGEGLGTFFIVSICDENVDFKKMLKKGYVCAAKIHDIQKLHELLNKHYTFDWKIGDIRFVKVEYNRGNDPRVSKDHPSVYRNVHYLQKSNEDAYQHEWRLVMKSEPGTNDEKEFTKIKIGNIKDIVSTKDF